MCRLTHDFNIETNDPLPPPNFEFLVFRAEEEDSEEIPDEISRLLEHDEKTIQPFEEPVEMINLGNEKDKKEVKVGVLLIPEVKERMLELLREYVDVFSWSYQDMPVLDNNILEHRLPLRPECPSNKQKFRRTHPNMADKIKEEV